MTTCHDCNPPTQWDDLSRYHNHHAEAHAAKPRFTLSPPATCAVMSCDLPVATGIGYCTGHSYLTNRKART